MIPCEVKKVRKHYPVANKRAPTYATSPSPARKRDAPLTMMPRLLLVRINKLNFIYYYK